MTNPPDNVRDFLYRYEKLCRETGVQVQSMDDLFVSPCLLEWYEEPEWDAFHWERKTREGTR